MRRSFRASVAGSLTCGVLVASAFTHGVGFGIGTAVAEPVTPQGIASLVAAVANADQKLQDLGANIQAEQEGVNKAIVAVQTARDGAVAAQSEVDTSQAEIGRAHV